MHPNRHPPWKDERPMLNVYRANISICVISTDHLTIPIFIPTPHPSASTSIADTHVLSLQINNPQPRAAPAQITIVDTHLSSTKITPGFSISDRRCSSSNLIDHVPGAIIIPDAKPRFVLIIDTPILNLR
jgi:hypothetical protein